MFILFSLIFFLMSALQCQGEQGTLDPYAMERGKLVQELQAQGIKDKRVLGVLQKLQRHLFVPQESQLQAYENHPLSIGFEQTISQPFIVGFMTEALVVKDGETILEIGTGSGFQAAVLSELAPSSKIYTIEVVEPLATRAAALLEQLGYMNIFVKAGDGYQGWPEHAPFDKIILTAAPKAIPEALLMQLKIGGVLVAPVGEQNQGQDLVRITRMSQTGFNEEKLLDVRFVPMVKSEKKDSLKEK